MFVYKKAICLVLFISIALISYFAIIKISFYKNKTINNINIYDKIYSKYEFDNSGKTINLAVRTFYSPVNTVIETMKRDEILRENLHKLGFNINFYYYANSGDLIQAFKKKHIHGGIASDTTSLIMATNIYISIVAMIPEGYTSVVSKNKALISDLKGGKIGYMHGSASYYVMLMLLDDNDIKESDVKWVKIPFEYMPDALIGNKIDAFVTREPFAEIATLKDKNAVAINKRLCSCYFYFTNEFYNKYPQASHYILASQLRALNWMKAKKENLISASQWILDNSKQMSLKETGINSEQIAKLVTRDILSVTPVSIFSIKDLEKDSAIYKDFIFLKRIKAIPDSTSWSCIQKAFNLKILNEIMSKKNLYYLDKFEYTTTIGIDDDQKK